MAKAKKVASSFSLYKDRDPASYRFYYPEYNRRDRIMMMNEDVARS